MKKYFNILLACIICLIFVSGCIPAERSNIHKSKVSYNSSTYTLHTQNSTISFINDSFPNKTHLTIIDILTRNSKKYQFAGYIFLGAHEIITDLNQAVAGAIHIEKGAFKNKILIIDLNSSKIINEFLLPLNCYPMLIRKPKWSDSVFVLIQHKEEQKTLLKNINLRDNTISDAEPIGNFFTKNALFMDDTPSLVLDIILDDKSQLVLYDINSKSITDRYPTAANFIELKESNENNGIYGPIQLAGDNKGRVVSFNLKDKIEKVLIELGGELDTALFVNDILYVIGKDLSRSSQQKKSWLHPRNIYLIDSQKSTPVDTLDWTQREGKLIGFDKKTNEIIYAVIDYDNPNIWFILNNKETLSRVKNIIK